MVSLEDKLSIVEKRLHEAFDDAELQKRLKKEDYDKLAASKKSYRYNKGDIIFDDGELPKGVFFISKGTAKLSKSGVYGKDQILRFIKEGDLIGYRSLLMGDAFQADFRIKRVTLD